MKKWYERDDVAIIRVPDLLGDMEEYRKSRSEARSPDSDLLTVEEAAEYLRCSVTEVYSMTRSRRKARGLAVLPAHRVGRKLLFKRSEIDRWLEEGGKK